MNILTIFVRFFEKELHVHMKFNLQANDPLSKARAGTITTATTRQ